MKKIEGKNLSNSGLISRYIFLLFQLVIKESGWTVSPNPNYQGSVGKFIDIIF